MSHDATAGQTFTATDGTTFSAAPDGAGTYIVTERRPDGAPFVLAFDIDLEAAITLASTLADAR